MGSNHGGHDGDPGRIPELGGDPLRSRPRAGALEEKEERTRNRLCPRDPGSAWWLILYPRISFRQLPVRSFPGQLQLRHVRSSGVFLRHLPNPGRACLGALPGVFAGTEVHKDDFRFQVEFVRP